MITFGKISMDPDYAKEWHEHCTDFIMVCDELGNPMREQLYRKGGLGGHWTDGYILLLKYVEDFYPKHILEMSGTKDSRHLNSIWCVLDELGNEVFVADGNRLDSLYHIGGLVFSYGDKLFRITDKYTYCESSSNTISTDNYVFIENAFDKDTTRRGVIKIDKHDGTYEIIN